MKQTTIIITTALLLAIPFTLLSNVAQAVAQCIGVAYECTYENYDADTDTPEDWVDDKYYGGYHNCTRYAAYRVALRGHADPGVYGDAKDWDTVYDGLGYAVNNTPAVGAIAQWNEGSGLGSDGHVAHVDAVLSNGEVELSDDAWGGATKRGLIVKSDDSGYRPWPDNFIHIADFAQEPTDGEHDANPQAVVGSAGTVYTLHVAGDGCAKIHRRMLGTSGFALHANVPITCDWSKAGFADMVMVPGTDNQAWMLLVKDVDGQGELYLYSMNGTTVTNHGQIGAGGWSIDAPPALSMDASGNLFIAAVKTGGDLWRFVRDAAGTVTNEGLLGENGSWASGGTVSLATAPSGETWLAAVKAGGDLWTFKRTTTGVWANMGTLGVSGWSPWAQPGLTVDNDGDVTVAMVKNGDANGALAWSYRRCSSCVDWHSIGQLGTTTEWSDQGTMQLVAAPNDHVWAAMVKQGEAGEATQWAAVMTPSSSQNHLGTWSGWTQVGASAWSPYSAPAVAVAGGGTVFVVKVKSDATMHAYQRNATTGAWSNYGQIGGSGWVGDQP